MRNCKNTRDVCPNSKLCPTCDSLWKDYSKRQGNQDRQKQARDQSHNSNRNLHSPRSSTAPSIGLVHQQGPSTSMGVPTSEAVSNQPLSHTSIDITSLHNRYNQLKT